MVPVEPSVVHRQHALPNWIYTKFGPSIHGVYDSNENEVYTKIENHNLDIMN